MRPSTVRYSFFSRVQIFLISSTEESEKINGLAPKEWGQIGVTQTQLALGSMIEPPADMEYAVDPVGVATIKPSAR